MKKNLLALFAVILAIGASAFTTTHTAKSKSPQPALFWYTLSSGQLQGPINSQAADKATFMASYVTCDDTDTPECLVGTENNDDQGNPVSIVDPNSDYHIRQTISR